MMNPYMFKEYLDIREVASLSVKGIVLNWKDYTSNNEVRELERKLLKAVRKDEIPARKYFLYNAAIFLHNWLGYFPKGCRIRMIPSDVTELYKKWGYNDMCFNPDKTQSESAPLPLIPWDTSYNAFAELIYVLFKKGYIGADSYSDALKKSLPHFNVDSNVDSLRNSLHLKQQSNPSFDSIPKANDFEEGKGCFSGIKPARKPINKRGKTIPK